MSDLFRVALPAELLPGSPRALERLDHELDGVASGGTVRLAEAWMLSALPARRGLLEELASAGRLEVERCWVRLDPYALPGYRAPDRALAEAACAAFPGAELVDPEPAGEHETHAARAGLCLEARALADRLVARAPAHPAVFASLLPALSPAGLGGRGDAVTERLAKELLLSACHACEVDPEPALALPPPGELPRRVRQLAIGQHGMAVSWSRSQGLAWQVGDLRDTGFLCSLEVQGDAGGRDAFVSGEPPRPRVFEARDMRPVLHAKEDELEFLSMEREIRLPSRAGAPGGRRCYVRWELDLRVDKKRRGLDVVVRLTGVPAGHRFRLWFPVPFHPRPSEVVAIEASGRTPCARIEGPFPARPAMAPVTLHGKGHALAIGGAGFREVEVFPRANDHVCAVTLLRAPLGETAPARVVRRFTVGLTIASP